MTNQEGPAAAPQWFRELKKFEIPSIPKAVWQLVNTIVPFLVCWGAMAVMLRHGVPYYFVLPLAIPTSLFLVRVFIFFHDCTHGSFFKNPHANAVVGWILGIFMFTAYRDWRRSHGIHHATNANLDRRGVGDVWTLTLEEFRASSIGRKLWYRIYRNPVFMFLIVPPILFLFIHRLPTSKAPGPETASVWLTNLGVAGFIVALGFLGGWDLLLLIHLPVLYLTWVIGVWLFYVQHQFDPGYWAHKDEWSAFDAAMLGSSHYKLPRLLQWFSGNIGLHHIHHLRPKIPNYNLERCYRAIKELQLPQPLTVFRSLRSLTLNLWDEKTKMLITFGQAMRLIKASLTSLFVCPEA
jgi:omega-6 fatty acid desaturase (delta-12 desaturase)